MWKYIKYHGNQVRVGVLPGRCVDCIHKYKPSSDVDDRWWCFYIEPCRLFIDDIENTTCRYFSRR